MMIKQSTHHPELRDGERWVTNMAIGVLYDYKYGAGTRIVGETKEKAFSRFCSESNLSGLRAGEIAYDIDGYPIAGMFPIFCKEDGTHSHE